MILLNGEYLAECSECSSKFKDADERMQSSANFSLRNLFECNRESLQALGILYISHEDDQTDARS